MPRSFALRRQVSCASSAARRRFSLSYPAAGADRLLGLRVSEGSSGTEPPATRSTQSRTPPQTRSSQRPRRAPSRRTAPDLVSTHGLPPLPLRCLRALRPHGWDGLEADRGGGPPAGTPAGLVVRPRTLCDGQRTMDDREVRIGTALRRMAEDLVVARRYVAELERENRRLSARLATVERREDVVQPSRSLMEEPSRT